MFRVSTIAALLACSTLVAQDSRNMILAAGRSGVVELINPSTLETVGRIHLDVGPRSAGLNGVSASADGSILYVEGPIPPMLLASRRILGRAARGSNLGHSRRVLLSSVIPDARPRRVGLRALLSSPRRSPHQGRTQTGSHLFETSGPDVRGHRRTLRFD